MNAFRRSVIAMIAALAATAASAQVPARISPADEAAVRELEAKSWNAWKSHDAAFFDRVLSADHVEVHSYGITGKDAVVAGVRDSACVVQTFALGPLALTAVAADTVLVTYRAEQDTSCGAARVPSPVFATSLYTRRDGQWQNVLYQHTPVAPTPPAAASAADAKTVADLDTEYQRAVKDNDVATMSRILADDFLLVTGRGKTFSKADLLQEADGRTRYDVQEEVAQSVRVWGDTAVVTALLWAKGADGGKPFDYKLWFSDVYVRTPNGWRYVLGQASLPLPAAQ